MVNAFPSTTLRETPNQSWLRGRHGRLRSLRVGFVQLSDAAPLILAEVLGLFEKHGITVELRRELGWATVRDKILYGELEAAQALAAMPFAATLGLHIPMARECVATMVLNVNGNGITLGQHLHAEGVDTTANLRAMARRRPATRPFTLGIVSLFSTHHILLRDWLSGLGLEVPRDARIVVIPPAQMLRSLESGNLDGYCVGEPWNTAAVRRGIGWIAATSATIAPDHPEKILMVRHDFMHNATAECLRLTAAILEACSLCDDPQQRRDLVRHMAAKRYLDCPESWLLRGFGLRNSIDAPLDEPDIGSVRFSGPGVNAPTSAHAQWILRGMRRCGQLDTVTIDDQALADNLFDNDFFNAASRVSHRTSPTQSPQTTTASTYA